RGRDDKERHTVVGPHRPARRTAAPARKRPHRARRERGAADHGPGRIGRGARVGGDGEGDRRAAGGRGVRTARAGGDEGYPDADQPVPGRAARRRLTAAGYVRYLIDLCFSSTGTPVSLQHRFTVLPQI